MMDRSDPREGRKNDERLLEMKMSFEKCEKKERMMIVADRQKYT